MGLEIDLLHESSNGIVSSTLAFIGGVGLFRMNIIAEHAIRVCRQHSLVFTRSTTYERVVRLSLHLLSKRQSLYSVVSEQQFHFVMNRASV